MATPLPLVVVESCSMYHNTNLDNWWTSNAPWYQGQNIEREDFDEFPFKNGLNKGDIILVSGRADYDVGGIIIFESSFRFPLIHRVIDIDYNKSELNVLILGHRKDIYKSSFFKL